MSKESREAYLTSAGQQVYKEISEMKRDIEEWKVKADSAMMEGNENFHYEALYAKYQALDEAYKKLQFLTEERNQLQ